VSCRLIKSLIGWRGRRLIFASLREAECDNLTEPTRRVQSHNGCPLVSNGDECSCLRIGLGKLVLKAPNCSAGHREYLEVSGSSVATLTTCQFV